MTLAVDEAEALDHPLSRLARSEKVEEMLENVEEIRLSNGKGIRRYGDGSWCECDQHWLFTDKRFDSAFAAYESIVKENKEMTTGGMERDAGANPDPVTDDLIEAAREFWRARAREGDSRPSWYYMAVFAAQRTADLEAEVERLRAELELEQSENARILRLERRANATRPPSADVADAVEVAKPYFAYDFDNNAEFFATEDEARKFAEAALEGAQECAGDTGWPENTTDICYGRIIGTVTLTRQLERPAAHLLDEDGCDPEGNCWQPEWSRMLWHELQPVAWKKYL